MRAGLVAAAREKLRPYADPTSTLDAARWAEIGLLASRALDCSPGLGDTDRKPIEALAALGEGQSSRMSGHDAEALGLLAAAVSLDPSLTDASVALASAQLGLGRASDALSTIASGLSRAPSDERLLLLRVRALLATGQTERAMAEMQGLLGAGER
jgi:Flp pilus assembly protein TadD